MFVATFLFLLCVFVLYNTSSTSVAATVLEVDCKDNELNTNCQCYFDEKRNFLVMTCESLLDAKLSKLPPFSVDTVSIEGAYSHWPTIPVEYQTTRYLVLAENQIDSIGDLSHLANLLYFNMSRNKLTKIDKSLSKLKELVTLDLSFNLLEVIHFTDFVSDCDKDTFVDPNKESIFSKLTVLLLNGNQIKKIHNFDVAFIGMPQLSTLNMDINMLTRLEVTGLCKQSLNVIKKARRALETNATYVDFVSAPSQYGYYFGFDANFITYVHFNFHAILNEITIMRFRVNFLLRFLAIYMSSESTKVICDCNMYNDFNFIVEQIASAFPSEKIPAGFLYYFPCYKKDSDTPINLLTMIYQNNAKRSDFCGHTLAETSTNDKSIMRKANTASSQIPSHFIKLITAATLMYSSCLFEFMP